MRRTTVAVLLVMMVLVGAAVSAQESEDVSSVEVEHLVGPLYMMTCDGRAATVASIGEDGVLLVDTGFTRTAEDQQPGTAGNLPEAGQT